MPGRSSLIYMPISDQGSLSDRYTLVPRTLIFLTCDQRILLLKGAPHKHLWANRYNGLGGHIERGEDVLSSALRELNEEAGIQDVDLWLCGVVTIDAGQNTGVGIYVIRGECSGAFQEKTSSEGALQCVRRSELADLPLVEDLPVLLPRVLAMHPGDPPFSAQYSYQDNGSLKVKFFGDK
jgi:8-oxo-dGTP diphosphatase